MKLIMLLFATASSFANVKRGDATYYQRYHERFESVADDDSRTAVTSELWTEDYTQENPVGAPFIVGRPQNSDSRRWGEATHHSRWACRVTEAIKCDDYDVVTSSCFMQSGDNCRVAFPVIDVYKYRDSRIESARKFYSYETLVNAQCMSPKPELQTLPEQPQRSLAFFQQFAEEMSNGINGGLNAYRSAMHKYYHDDIVLYNPMGHPAIVGFESVTDLSSWTDSSELIEHFQLRVTQVIPSANPSIYIFNQITSLVLNSCHIVFPEVCEMEFRGDKISSVKYYFDHDEFRKCIHSHQEL